MENQAMLVLRHAVSGETWNLSAGRLVVARKDTVGQLELEPGDAPLALDDELVSRRHAIIHLDRGRYWITDQDSTDGTFVNEEEIHGTTPIADGDKLRFGDSVLIGTIEQSTPPASAAHSSHPADLTLQYRRVSTPVVQAEAERTVFQAPPVTPPAVETPARFSPVPTGATTQPRPSTTPSTSQPVIPAELPTAGVVSIPAVPSRAIQEEAAVATRRPRIDDIGITLRQVEREAASAIERFDQAGGRRAVESFLAVSAQMQSSVVSREDIDALLKQLPAICRLLELELQLIDMVSTPSSDAPG
jgi:predicted component of type VI protein secretion system